MANEEATPQEQAASAAPAKADKPAAPAEPSKPKAPKAEGAQAKHPKGEGPKAEAQAKAPKAEAAQGKGPKAEAPKGEDPRAGVAKAEAPKPEAAKAEASKAGAPAAEPAKVEPPAPVEEPSLTAPPLPEGVKYIFGTGRRKKAVARVRIRPGTGAFLVNKKEMGKFFQEVRDQQAALTPLKVAHMVKSYDVWANVNGGGRTGQSCAIRMGLARALVRAAPDLEAALRAERLLTRDSRMKERKKYGQKGARKRFQYSKR